MQPILYSFRRCPYAMRARMALHYSGIELEHREILLKNKPDSMLKYSPKGTVPVLVVEQKVIDESLDVMYWALAKNDPNNWLCSEDETKQKQISDVIHRCDHEFKSQLDHYKYADRFELSEQQYRDRTLWFLALLEQMLNKNKYLVTNHVTLADVAIFPFIRQYAFVNKKWFDQTPYLALKKWLDSWLSDPLFKEIMHKHELWSDDLL